MDKIATTILSGEQVEKNVLFQRTVTQAASRLDIETPQSALVPTKIELSSVI